MTSYLSDNIYMDMDPDFLLSFRRSHYSSVVSNLRIKYKKGSRDPVWIDVTKITIQELQELDEDEEIKELIKDKGSLRYRDRD